MVQPCSVFTSCYRTATCKSPASGSRTRPFDDALLRNPMVGRLPADCCARGERPRYCRAAEHGNELPPSDADCHLPAPPGITPVVMQGRISRPNRPVCDGLRGDPGCFCCGCVRRKFTPPAISSPTMDTTLDHCNTSWAIKISCTRCDTPKWLLIGSRISGRTDDRAILLANIIT